MRTTEKIEGHYLLVQDNDSHWYLIPDGCRQYWENWRDSVDAMDGILPQWCIEIDGPHSLVIVDPEIIR